MMPGALLGVLLLAASAAAQQQQTFQSTIFDIPAELPPEDYAVLSQVEEAPVKKIKDSVKPIKVNKAALQVPQVQPATPPPAPAPPQPLPQPPYAAATPSPFTFPTHPTIAPFTFPTHPTIAPFTFPTHPTVAPFSFPGQPTPPPPPFIVPTHHTMGTFTLPTHPTLPPFTFPTHPTIAPFTAAPPPAQFSGINAHAQQYQQYGQQQQQQAQQGVQQPQEQQGGVGAQQQQYSGQFGQAQQLEQFGQQQTQKALQQPYQQYQQQYYQYSQIYAPQQQVQQPQQLQLQPPQQPQPHSQLQQPQPQTQVHYQQHYPQYQVQAQQQVAQPPGQFQQQPQQFEQVQPQVQAQQQVPAATLPSVQQGVPQQRFERIVTAGEGIAVGPPRQLQPLPQASLPVVNAQVQESAQLVQPVPTAQAAVNQGRIEKVSSSTPNRVSLWFKEQYDTTACQKNLSNIAQKFRTKFPVYLQKGGKDAALAELIEQRLIECERKSTASHWDKVDSLLTKVSLSKSEESECRSGLIQERISCVNLLNYACQFIDPTFVFRLVPARITIQEARQAENGAEKCRKVVRLVKKRLEG
ncbi:unnamed protein product [Cylicocyclus nassatus]|uniref:Uncharacterized protein n=1 Tax=Cylicocyclus nassatus TaxID=53992 RepID=A0AA36GR14_CYLNA|nr:unnamed protein product [Cylicocyclus nassatus]